VSRTPTCGQSTSSLPFASLGNLLYDLGDFGRGT
jgi:hypothetical protein